MKFLILAALLAVAAAGEVKIHDCGHGEVSKVEIAGCSGDYCVIHKSKPFDFSATFTANQDSSKLELKVTGTMNGIEVPIPGVETNGCKLTGVKCPIHKGDKITAQYHFNLPSIIPTTKTTVTVKLIGDHGVVACGSLNGEVQA